MKTERVRIVKDAGPLPYPRRASGRDPWIQRALLALTPGSAAAFSLKVRTRPSVTGSVLGAARTLAGRNLIPPGSIVTRYLADKDEVWAYRLSTEPQEARD